MIAKVIRTIGIQIILVDTTRTKAPSAREKTIRLRIALRMQNVTGMHKLSRRHLTLLVIPLLLMKESSMLAYDSWVIICTD